MLSFLDKLNINRSTPYVVVDSKGLLHSSECDNISESNIKNANIEVQYTALPSSTCNIFESDNILYVNFAQIDKLSGEIITLQLAYYFILIESSSGVEYEFKRYMEPSLVVNGVTIVNPSSLVYYYKRLFSNISSTTAHIYVNKHESSTNPYFTIDQLIIRF